MNISFVLPGIKIIHFKGLRKIGESKIGAYKWLAHYNRSRRCVGRTIKTTFNEPNHYDRRNVSVGYSRKRGWRTYLHFDRNGKLVGYSKRLFGLIWLHYPVNKKKELVTRIYFLSTDNLNIENERRKQNAYCIQYRRGVLNKSVGFMCAQHSISSILKYPSTANQL